MATSRKSRIFAFALALVFTFVSVFAAAAAPTYAASKPAKVKGLKAATVTTSVSSIKLTWKKAKNAKKYEIYQATSKNGKYKKVATTTKKAYTVKKLKANKKYYFKLKAVNGKKKSAFSAVAYAKTGSVSKKVTVDEATRSVSIEASVNATFFTESTRHFIINNIGFNKGKSLLNAAITPDALYEGLVQAGGVSCSEREDFTLDMGEKITPDNNKIDNPDYSHLDITVSWGNKSYDISQVLTTKKGGKTPPKIDMVFSGNPKAAAKTPSGCIACMDSCYIGIVSNCEYGLCVIDNMKPALYGRKDVLPADGTKVIVTFTVK